MTLDPKALKKAVAILYPSLDGTHKEAEAITTVAITAYLAATKATAPDPALVSGWRMVPVEPTKAQIELLAKAYDRSAFDPEEDGLLDVVQPRRDRCLYDARKLFHLLLAAAPEPPVSDGFPREHVTRKFICDGCPDLKTKNWTFEGENDDYDSGTRAFCGDRSISAYWRKNEEVPKWCPRLPAPPKQQEPK